MKNIMVIINLTTKMALINYEWRKRIYATNLKNCVKVFVAIDDGGGVANQSSFTFSTSSTSYKAHHIFMIY